MEHHITRNGEADPGNLRNLAGVEAVLLLLLMLQRHDGVADARQLRHVDSVCEKSQTEGQRHLRRHIDGQNRQRKSQHAQDPQDGGVDVGFVSFLFFHRRFLRCPTGSGRFERFVRLACTDGGHGG